MMSDMMARAALGAILLALHTPASIGAQKARSREPLGGFNIFTASQDIVIGQQSVAAAEQQMVLLGMPAVDRYVNQIVAKLQPFAPGAKFPYLAKVVNGADINAFSLPGGRLYVNRGLIEAARNEGELAGAIAHEMAHVALRHGSTNVSNAYLGKTGLGLLGGPVSGQSLNVTNVIKVVGGPGLNATFLKFSMDDEYAADRVGTLMMARAGYPPQAMTSFLALLRESHGRDPHSVEMLFGAHPPALEREARVSRIGSELSVAATSNVGSLDEQRRLMAAKPVATAESGIKPAPVSAPNPPMTAPLTPPTPVHVAIPTPSARLFEYRQPTGFFTIKYPDNWRAMQTPGAFGVTIAPRAGLVTLRTGQQAIAYGVLVNHYYPFDGESTRREASMSANYAPFDRTATSRGALEDATDDLVRAVIRANEYLKALPNSAKLETIDGARAYSVVLVGISPLTGEEEKVKVFTRLLPDDHVIFALCVAPTRDFNALDAILVHIIRSLNVNEDAVHGSPSGTP